MKVTTTRRKKWRTYKTWTRAERNAAWIEEFCLVPEGALRGQPVRLRDWQVGVLREIYDSSTRTMILSLPRKNAKTALISFLILLHISGPEAEPGSEVVSGARSRDQASMVFRYAQKIVQMSDALRGLVRVVDSKKELICDQLQTSYKALSADAATNIGRSPVLAIHDELGQVRGPRDAFFEAIDTAQGAHADPLTIIISTQAPTDGDLLSIMIDDALAGHDPRTKAVVYSAPDSVDPFSEKALKLANPAYGDFLNADYCKEQAAKAARMPSAEAAYRNLILNQRVNATNPFVQRKVWEHNGAAPDMAAFETGDVYCGLDLSARNDLTAFVGVVEAAGVWHADAHFFAPADGVLDRAHRDRVPYDVWAQQGQLHLTPGATVDYEYVARWIADWAAGKNVRAVRFDRWRIDLFSSQCERLGVKLPLVPHGQGYKDMAPALDELEAILAGGKMRHGMQPVLTMCAANAIATQDAAGNRKLDKSRTNGRIDGMVALAMAIGGAKAEDSVESELEYKLFFV